MTESVDGLELAARTDAGPDRYEFATADGLCSPDEVRTAELLLAEALWERSPGELLVAEANYGVVGTLLAGIATSVTMTESSARAARFCRENAGRNGTEATVSLVATPEELSGTSDDHAARSAPFDVLAYAPKPYTPLAVGRQRIVDSLAVLAPGARCYVAAEPTTGLARYRETLEAHCETVEAVAERDGATVLEGKKSPDADSLHDVTATPSYVEPRIHRTSVDGTELELVTVPGLFAAGSLDHGTRLLLETVDVPDGARVLDVCCGYGPIGAYAAASADCSVVLSDDDRVATRCAACSLERSGLEGFERSGIEGSDRVGAEATAVTGDCTRAVSGRTFDLVLSNPPTHAGSGVLSELFGGIRDVLAADGECLFVRHEALDLSGHLRGFGSVETVTTGEEHVVRRAVP